MLKDVAKRFVRRLGWDLRRWDIANSSDARIVQRLKAQGVNLVFDVGANVGQFGKSLWNAGYTGRIVSFEPLSAAYRDLVMASGAYPSWEVAPQMAIGSKDGEIQINVASNSVSSSVLDMLDTFHNANPSLSYVGKEVVPLRRLDTVGPHYVHCNSVPFLKIDTQGFEANVLDGAPKILEMVAGVQLELALTPLYENECTYDVLMGRLQALGFNTWGIEPGFTHPESGRLLEIDATLFRD